MAKYIQWQYLSKVLAKIVSRSCEDLTKITRGVNVNMIKRRITEVSTVEVFQFQLRLQRYPLN